MKKNDMNELLPPDQTASLPGKLNIELRDRITHR